MTYLTMRRQYTHFWECWARKKNASDGCGSDGSSRSRSSFRPIRILQFGVTLLLFTFVIYMTAIDPLPMTHVTCLLLITLTSMYVFVLVLDIMNEFNHQAQRETPMFVFSFLGMIFFGVAGALLFFFPYSEDGFWAILAAVVLSFLNSLLFLIDVLTLVVQWKRKTMETALCRRCCASMNEKQTEVLYQRCERSCPNAETATCDLMTSVSNLGVSTEGECCPPPQDHTCRKTGKPRRRQYVDCPTNAPSRSVVECAKVQTECQAVRMVDCQTHKARLREAVCQTASRCEMCNQQMTPYSSIQSACNPTKKMSSAQCSFCPTFVQLIRGGMSPCGNTCRCTGGIMQMQPQQRGGHQETSCRQENLQCLQSIDRSNTSTPMCAKVCPGQETVTKVTLGSFCTTPKKIQSECQTTDSFPATCPRIKPTCPRIEPTCTRIEPTCPRIEPTCPRIEPTCPRIEPTCPRIGPTCPDSRASNTSRQSKKCIADELVDCAAEKDVTCGLEPICGPEDEPICCPEEEPICCPEEEPICCLEEEPICCPDEVPICCPDEEPICGEEEEPICGVEEEPICGEEEEQICDEEEEPICGVEEEPICGVEEEPICGAEEEPICGVEEERICGVEEEPICGVEKEPICGVEEEPICGVEEEPICCEPKKKKVICCPSGDKNKRVEQECCVVRCVGKETQMPLKDFKDCQTRDDMPTLALYAHRHAEAVEQAACYATRPRTHAFHKKNKIDPHMEKRCKGGTGEAGCSIALGSQASPHERQCLSNADASQYYTSQKEKRGKRYCDNCGATNFVKLKDQKRISCVKCGFSVRQPTVSAKKRQDAAQKGEHYEQRRRKPK